ncbi:type II toxin-antitoxin system VapC family toxin [Mycobacterium hubeiense]|uniref:type II toxin-antitoxin system VapC family toxin n=1 Tax=Mycobacterium hubeiense TaxID=1867256 RepID=UPI000C7EEF2B|nr:type II toxin-antitoxin system VapC family toxin [Mycobacterium sp. QGD 101]
MILVDTSVWIDHFHANDPRLAALLVADEVGCHPMVIEELALGSITQREVVLDSLENLHQFPVVTHEELLHLVNSHRLWGRGLSAVDAGLLGSVLIADGAKLWTRDKRLKQASIDVGVASIDEE